MAIDWASSDDEEFPDLDVVLSRANNSMPEQPIKASDRQLRAKARAHRTIDDKMVPSMPTRELSSEADNEEGKEIQEQEGYQDQGEEDKKTTQKGRSTSRPKASAAQVRRRRLGPRTENPLLKPVDGATQKGKSRPVLPTKSSKDASLAEDLSRLSVEYESTSSGDGMSVFIVDSDDSGSSSRRVPPARSKKSTLGTAGSARVKQRGIREGEAFSEEEELAVERPSLVRQSRKPEVSSSLSPPSGDVTEALSRLDIGPADPQVNLSKLSPPRPTTPPKGRIPSSKTLVSPRKFPAIPKTPHRPSADIFWDQEFVNEWNEEHSPRKLFLPSANKSPVKSLVKSPTKGDRSRDREIKKTFGQRKHQLAESFLQELDTTITQGQLRELASSTGGIKIQWSNKLNTTAGRANWRCETIRSQSGLVQEGKNISNTSLSTSSSAKITRRHHASIELAEKVIGDNYRLLNVIAHEFCHLANFMVSGVTGNPHGKEFKAWAAKVTRAFGDRDIEVTTKHSYEIDFKYIWQCMACDVEYKRHSKSINPERHRCGACKSQLKQTRPVPRAARAKKSEYQLFMQEQMRVVREENPGTTQKDVMRIVAEKWASKTGQKEGPRGAKTVTKGPASSEASVGSISGKLADLMV